MASGVADYEAVYRLRLGMTNQVGALIAPVLRSDQAVQPMRQQAFSLRCIAQGDCCVDSAIAPSVSPIGSSTAHSFRWCQSVRPCVSGTEKRPCQRRSSQTASTVHTPECHGRRNIGKQCCFSPSTCFSMRSNSCTRGCGNELRFGRALRPAPCEGSRSFACDHEWRRESDQSSIHHNRTERDTCCDQSVRWRPTGRIADRHTWL